MMPAVWPRPERTAVRMLHADPTAPALTDRSLADLPHVLRAGDLVVVNDAATLPASLVGRARSGAVELRLTGAGVSGSTGAEESRRIDAGGSRPKGAIALRATSASESQPTWSAVLFGNGTWRQRTEDRPHPPVLSRGEVIAFEPELERGLRATVTNVSERSPRLIELRFDEVGAALWASLYRAGRPVQYSYLCGGLALWHVQTAYGARPWAAEMPSAGWGLTTGTLRELRRVGVQVASVTHAAGLSSVGDPLLDAMLPFPERFDIPEATVRAVERTRARRGRVLAVGTTVVRALEGSAAQTGGVLRPGEGVTDIRLHEGFRRHVVDGLITGLHETGTSHFELLSAFVPRALLQSVADHAERAGYLGHEFGDTCLILGSASPFPDPDRALSSSCS